MKINVAECNLCKVKLRANVVSSLLLSANVICGVTFAYLVGTLHLMLAF